MFANFVDFSDAKKTRKALLAVAISTLFASNVVTFSGSFSLFGPAVTIDQIKLVGFGRIASFFLLTVFLIRSGPIFVESLSKTHLELLSRQEKLASAKLKGKWVDIIEPFDQQPRNNTEAHERQQYELAHSFTLVRTRRQQTYEFLVLFTHAATILLVDFSLPILLGVTAFLDPHRAGSFLEMLP
ncbi:hypothetical protein [Leisingera thetidis]|uniref:hypothetical protein n=1 Tax=Leisingera thetidis TaxID=2930199 RepID=UPI0021F7DF5B|nr:hypothetical protein [Leisingera thetidis]